MRVAQASSATHDQDSEEARRRLKRELDRIRGHSHENDHGAPVPAQAKKKGATSRAEEGGKAVHATRSIDSEIDRILGRLLLVRFKGTQPSETGPKAVHTMLQNDMIAGVLLTAENIQGKAQLRELTKFFASAGARERPIIGVQEVGGNAEGLPNVRDFEPWPTEREVAAKGDPDYAYSTYRSMGANLAFLGFNMNFGPMLGAPDSADAADSFGANPLQAGVFAKTFILGHRDANVIPVPVVDGSDLSVRALKTLILSHPETSIATDESHRKDGQPFSVYDGLVRAARFCFTTVSRPDGQGGEGPKAFLDRCDVLVLDGGTENPAGLRDAVAQQVSKAVSSGALTVGALKESEKRMLVLRSTFSTPSQ